METANNQLYNIVVKITRVYLGPAADRFIARQIQNHLHKPPESLSRDDLRSLIDWIRIAISLITEDGAMVEEYTNELERLAQPGPIAKQAYSDHVR